jgi:hypothetical protein
MKEIKPDEFGDIRKITVKQSYDIEPFMMMAARGMLAGDLRPMIELEEATVHKVEFPEEVEITVTYDDFVQSWSAFNVPTDSLKDITDTWNECPIYIQATRGRNGQKDMWKKFVCGYEFMITSYSYTKLENCADG